MMIPVISPGNCNSEDDADFAAILESQIVDVAVPVVRRTVKRRFASARFTTDEDLEDVCADALSALIVCLRRERAGGPEIGEFANYAARIASNTTDRFFASRTPQRARLRVRIRYVLTTDPCFTLSQNAEGDWICALRKSGGAATKLPGLLRDLLKAGPLELTDLTTQAANALGISDRIESVEDHVDLLRDPAPSFAHTAEMKQWLKRLWSEVCRLPLLQRIALLLNLGSSAGPSGGTTMCALADLGVATFAALAESLEISEAELAALWNRVPLADLEIAARLKIERQQVINLRASARQRLGRRLQPVEINDGRTNMRVKSGTETEKR